MNRRVFKNIILSFINDRKWAGRVLLLLAGFIPRSNRSSKFRNVLEAYAESILRIQKVVSRPLIVRLATVAVCNYKCLFCEVHKDDLLFPKRNPNRMTPEDFLNYEGVFASAWKLDLYGGSAEPLVNKEICFLTEHLKREYGTEMFLNTNASLLSEDMAETFVRTGFDQILVSYHAGTPEVYKSLMTGDIQRVDQNLGFLRDRKKKYHSKKPEVYFNFALQRMNAKEGVIIFDKAKTLGAAGVYINRYYGGRNKLQDQEVSFEYDPEAGNKALAEIYCHAAEIGIKTFPAKPSFWKVEKEKDSVPQQWDAEKWDRDCRCHYPWIQIHFEPVLDAPHCHYVAVCNRMLLFKLDYSKVSLKTGADCNKIWNHPLMQYLRSTVNCSSKSNPMCRFCKHPGLPRLRNLDAERYAQLRDQAVEDFFKEARSFCRNIPDIDGLEILTDNPVSERKFQEKLRALDAQK